MARVLDIDAKWYHRASSKVQFSTKSRADTWNPIAYFVAAISGGMWIVSIFTVLFGSDPWWLSLCFLAGWAVPLFLAEGTFRAARSRVVDNYNRREVVETYNSLLPHNKELARPLVEKLMHITPTESYYHTRDEYLKTAWGMRQNLLSDIKLKDIKERGKKDIITDEDVHAVKAFLEGYKELT